MNTLSTRTLGHLIHLAVSSNISKSDVRDLLMQSGLYEATGMDAAALSGPNKQELLRAPLLNAHEMATFGNREAHDALLKIVWLGAERVAAWYRDADTKLSTLRESLLSDGYELRLSGSVGGWDTDWAGVRGYARYRPVRPPLRPR